VNPGGPCGLRGLFEQELRKEGIAEFMLAT
jgi:hypothetical protein